MSWLSRLSDRRELQYQQKNSPRIAPVPPDEPKSVGSLVDAQVERQPDETMIITRDRRISWREFQLLSNRVAHLLQAQGIGKGDAVALFMGNDILYLACVVGITRLGAVAGLINTNLTGASLVHCVQEVEPRLSLVDGAALASILDCEADYLRVSPSVVCFAADEGSPAALVPQRSWLHDGNRLLAAASDQPPALAQPVLAGDLALYIFTSGTTGLPKASRLTHRKLLYGAGGMAVIALRAGPKDRLYNCLPLYHGTGLIVGAGACLYSGASMFLAPRFSASTLVDEANRYGCNLLVYVGEICRYLLNTPERPNDSRCRLERAVGNGLRPDIWKPFKRRFGLKRITEFYGASEANGGFMNAFNKDETIGITSSNVRLVQHVAEDATVVRGADGYVIAVPRGEPGLMLIEVSERDRFDGYKNAEQSERKLVRSAFSPGDCWFNSGDVLREVDVGFSYPVPHYQFVDRLGDTFRWKSENVSTSELAELVCRHVQVAFACVYGVPVPGTEGKACMVALVLADDVGEFDLPGFNVFVAANLPRYMRPMFVRICSEFEFTGTHKIIKTRLIAEGFDVGRIDDPTYCWDAGAERYVPLSPERCAEIQAGRSGY